jgi:hypothetical protein
MLLQTDYLDRKATKPALTNKQLTIFIISGFAAASLLEFLVRISPGAQLSLSCECCVCQVQVPEMGRSITQRSPAECVCVSLNVIICNINHLHLPLMYVQNRQE